MRFIFRIFLYIFLAFLACVAWVFSRLGVDSFIDNYDTALADAVDMPEPSAAKGVSIYDGLLYNVFWSRWDSVEPWAKALEASQSKNEAVLKECQYRRAMASAGQGNLATGLAKLRETFPEERDYLWRAAVLHEVAGDSITSLQLYERYWALDKTGQHLTDQVITLLDHEDRIAEALELAKRIDPANIDSLAELMAKEYKLNKASASSSLHQSTYVALGKAALHQGDFAAAVEHFTTVVDAITSKDVSPANLLVLANCRIQREIAKFQLGNVGDALHELRLCAPILLARYSKHPAVLTLASLLSVSPDAVRSPLGAKGLEPRIKPRSKSDAEPAEESHA